MGRVVGYLQMHARGELRARAEAAVDSLRCCRLCPRRCGVNRLSDEKGFCETGRRARVASWFAHMGEEDCLRGWRGSGTVFFGSCNVRCCFCQNCDISHVPAGHPVDASELARIMLELQTAGCHNINLVTPSHVVPQVLEALVVATEAGLRLPVVYNTSAFDCLQTLRLLDGVIDIYMPDFKLWDEQKARRYLGASDYPEVARQAIKEMHRQVGDLVLDEHGLAVRGVLVRHLVMPHALDDTAAIMRYLGREISSNTYVNIMAQYRPAGLVGADRFSEINRGITRAELTEAYRTATQAGLHRFDERR